MGSSPKCVHHFPSLHIIDLHRHSGQPQAGTCCPDAWRVEPNRLDRIDDIIPDNPMKDKAHRENRAFLPYPVMGGQRGQDGEMKPEE